MRMRRMDHRRRSCTVLLLWATILSTCGAYIMTPTSRSTMSRMSRQTRTMLLLQQQQQQQQRADHPDGWEESRSLENQEDRRGFLEQAVVASLGFVLANHYPTSAAATAAAAATDESISSSDDDATTTTTTKKKRVVESEEFGYRVKLPPGLEASPKPLKTHLDEQNYTFPNKKKYQYGMTVDPVRLVSLREFGTPEQVAARVVTAEVNRDGVTSVTLVTDPTEDPTTGAYILNYLSQGKRGLKHFVTSTIVQKGKLYVLTVQALEEDYSNPASEQEIMEAVRSFRVR